MCTTAVSVQKKKRLYELILKPVLPKEAMLTTMEPQKLWHHRVGHVSEDTMRKAIRLVKGIPLRSSSDGSSCDDCMPAKYTRAPEPAASKDANNTTKPLELVNSDVKGTFETMSLCNLMYFITLYGDSSALLLARFLKNSVEVEENVKNMIPELEKARVARFVV